MNLVDFVEAWWLSVRPLIERAGVVGHFERSSDNRSKASCALNVRQNELEADLMVWESGEAELAIGEPGGRIKQQHFDDIRSPTLLSSILLNVIHSVLDINPKKP